jgi:hypothetical protein
VRGLHCAVAALVSVEDRQGGYLRSDDFFIDDPSASPDPWGRPRQQVNVPMLDALRRGPLDGSDDMAVAIGLSRLLHEDLEAFGTSGGERMLNDEMRLAIRAQRAVLARLGITFELPWRDLMTFRSHWIGKGCANSYQARRDLLEQHFEPLHTRLIDREDRELRSVLAEPVSPHAGTGWPQVDEEIRELTRRFRSSTTPQDYRAVGTHCMGVLEALSRTVYKPQRHLREGEMEPPVDKSKQRISRYVEDAVPGKGNEEVRGLANKAIELAHRVKHSETPTRRDAGISADAVILLANILRRLEQEF